MKFRYWRRRGRWVRRVEICLAIVTLFAAGWGATAVFGTQDVELWARSMLPADQGQQVTTGYRGAEPNPAADPVSNTRAPFPFLVTVDVRQELAPGMVRQARLSVIWLFGMMFQVSTQRL